MLGGHVVKTGLAPLLLDLMRRGIITHLAMNGSAAIHDYEIARFGGTSEDVAAGLRDGTFGMAEETGRGLNEAFTAGMREKRGMGEAIAVALEGTTELAHPELSVILGAHRLGLPATVHAALGAEIIHQHPAADGAAIGDTSHRDFRRLAASLPSLHDGGVVLNLGSAVIMPEVFLKALTIARNLGTGKPTDFTTCDLDMQRHYRPRVNVVQRPTLAGGTATRSRATTSSWSRCSRGASSRSWGQSKGNADPNERPGRTVRVGSPGPCEHGSIELVSGPTCVRRPALIRRYPTTSRADGARCPG